MSDIKSCPYCVGYETTAGFVHFAGCPLDKSAAPKTMQDEIARLKAALEKAEMESVSLCATLITRGTELHLARERRDEARRWAKYYQKLAQQWRKAYENVWKNNHVMPFGSIMYGTQKPRQNDE